MKRAVCFVVCVILAVAGAAGSIYLHGERKISGSQVASGRLAASEIEVWGTVGISTKAKAPADSLVSTTMHHFLPRFLTCPFKLQPPFVCGPGQ